MAKEKYFSYPTTPNTRTGCKVGWRYYDREIDAKECSRRAKHNAKLQADLGFDFGYCSPGSITKMAEDSDFMPGKYEVCVP